MTFLCSAVGTRKFVESIQAKLGFKAVGRRIIEKSTNAESAFREEPDTNDVHFEGEIGVLSHNNSLFWNVNFENSVY